MAITYTESRSHGHGVAELGHFVINIPLAVALHEHCVLEGHLGDHVGQVSHAEDVLRRSWGAKVLSNDWEGINHCLYAEVALQTQLEDGDLH